MATKNEEETALAVIDPSNFAVVEGSADLSEIIADNFGDNEQISQFDLVQVRVPGSGGTMWKIPSVTGDQLEKNITGVVIHHQPSRSWWDNSYEDDPGQPPDCRSDDSVHGIGEQANSVEGRLCSNCPLSLFGSDPKGSGGQACKQFRSLYVMRQDDFLPIVVRVPPSSLKSWKQHVSKLLSSRLSVTRVITELSLVVDKNKKGVEFSRIEFELAGVLDSQKSAAFVEASRAMRSLFSTPTDPPAVP